MVALLVLVYDTRGAWFFYDDWNFVGPERDSLTVDTLLRPHNEHWSTVPLVVFRLLEHFVGLHSYAPYLAVLFAVHLLATHLLWRVMLRCGSAPWVATGLGWVFGVLGVAYENLVWAFQIGFVGSVALGLAAVLRAMAQPRGARVNAVLVLLVVGNLATSGVGLVFLVLVPAVVALRSRRRAVLVFLLPLLTYLFWHAEFGAPLKAGLTNWGNPSTGLVLAVFVLVGLSWATVGGLGLPLNNPSASTLIHAPSGSRLGALLAGFLGVVMLAGAVLRLARRADSEARAASVIASGPALFFLLTSLARAGWGVEEAESSRYTYIAVALALPALALLLTSAPWLLTRAAPVTLTCLAVVWGLNVAKLTWSAGQWVRATQDSRRTMEASAALADSGAPVFDDAQLEPTRVLDVTIDDVRRWRRDGTLHAPAGAHTPTDRASASLNMQVAVRPVSASGLKRCQLVHPGSQVLVPLHPGSVMTVRASRFTILSLTLTTADGATSRPQLTDREAGDYEISSLLSSGTLAVTNANGQRVLSRC